ncbi:hypothetical protein FRC01_010771, partial [Tulasnella sp. 417]
MATLLLAMQKPLELTGHALLSLSRATRSEDPEAENSDPEEDESVDGGLSSVLEMVGLPYLGISQVPTLFRGPVSGRGPRGPYNQFTKAEDFFRV